MAVSFKNFNYLFPPPIKNKITFNHQIKLNKNRRKVKIIPLSIKTAIKLNIKN